MKYKTIAIIDNGVNSGKFDFNLKEDIDFTNYIINKKYSKYHGTMCAAIIKKYCPSADIISLRVLGEDQKGSIDFLYRAIDWCIKNKIHIINMSLGTCNFKDRDKLLKIINKAAKFGIIIIAAKSNNKYCSFPSSFSNVIGVRAINSPQNEEYEFFNNYLDAVDVGASSIHSVIDNTNEKHFTNKANSFAAPYVTTKVCEIMNKYNTNNLDKIKNILYNRSNSEIKHIIYHRVDWMESVVIINLIKLKNIEKINYGFKILKILPDINSLHLIKEYFDTIVIVYSNEMLTDELKECLPTFNKNMVFIDMNYNLNEKKFDINTIKKIWHNSSWDISCTINNSNSNTDDIPMIVISDNNRIQLINTINTLKEKFTKLDYNSLIVSNNPLVSLTGNFYIPTKALFNNTIIDNLKEYYRSDILIIGLDINEKQENLISLFSNMIDIHVSFTENNIFQGEKNILVSESNTRSNLYDSLININNSNYYDELFNNILSFFEQ